MFKMSLAIMRHQDLTRAEFLSYWLDHHGPLVRSLASDIRLRRYVQLHGEDCEISRMFVASRGLNAVNDGVAELWFDSEEDRLEAAATEAGQRASALLRADEMKFLDLARCTLTCGREHQII